MAAIGSDVITVHRAPMVDDDRYGAQRRDWAAATETVVTGVSVQPFTAAEVIVDREYTATRLRLYAPGVADVLAADRVSWRGETFDVDGEPGRWYDATGRLDHIEAVLLRRSG